MICRAYCNLGLSHLALGDADRALECQKFFLTLTHIVRDVENETIALGNIGQVLVHKGQVAEAVSVHLKQLELAKQAENQRLEAAACAALGSAHTKSQALDKALAYYTQVRQITVELGMFFRPKEMLEVV